MKKQIVFYLMLIEAICLHSQIIDKKMHSGFRTSNSRTIDAVIIHSTFNNSGGEIYDIDKIIQQFKRYGVSAHYLIGREGQVYRLVEEKNIAFHAGKSRLPDGRTALNSCSIGIELACSYTDSVNTQQMNAIVKLTKEINNRHKLKYILRHSDVAPTRKTDPWNFNWEEYKQLLEIALKQHPQQSPKQ